MSQTAPIAATSAAPRPEVEGAIRRAAAATGTDFSYLLGQARLESSLDPSARAGTSSAAGLFQFTASTWLAMLDRHGERLGIDPSGGAARAELLALRFDPQASALMAGELAQENRAALIGVLGREPDPAELYLAHFLGAAGAGKFLSALASDSGQRAASLMPQAAAANRAVFFDPNGAPRSLGQVMDLLRTRMTGAMGDAGPEFPFATPAERGWGWGSLAAGTLPSERIPGDEGISSSSRPSMADTLAAAFGGGGEAAMPGHVRAAYGRFKGLGL